MSEKMTEVIAFKPLNRPNQKTVQVGETTELLEEVVVKLEAGSSPSVRRVKPKTKTGDK